MKFTPKTASWIVIANVFAAALLFSCSGTDRWVRLGIVNEAPAITRNIGQGKDTVNILYTGCGGLLIERNGEALITDPYYTSHLLKSGRHNLIQPNPANRQRVMDSVARIIDPRKIAAVLVSHAHYDHLEDLPGLLTGYLSPEVKVLASTSAYCTVKNFITTQHFINTDEIQYFQGPARAAERNWVRVSKGMRVLPIHASHADHFYAGVYLMSGPTDCNKFADYKDPNQATDAMDWHEGSTYSYLVDLLGESDTMRIFIQTSGCKPADGFPPRGELHNKRVDLAILCVASHKYAGKYPDSLLAVLNPRQTMLIHWEDFFIESMYVKDPKRVALTRIGPLMDKMKKHYRTDLDHLRDSVFMPKPLTRIIVTH